jgi:hypothetical protein
MRVFSRAVIVLAFTGFAAAAQARPSIGVSGRDCGSPNLSQSIGVRHVAVQQPSGLWCVPYNNDVGTVIRITIESDVPLDDLEVLPGSALRQMRIDRERRLITLYDGYLRTPDIAIEFLGLSGRVFVTVTGYKTLPQPSPQP